jgi:hypothetical protein
MTIKKIDGCFFSMEEDSSECYGCGWTWRKEDFERYKPAESKPEPVKLYCVKSYKPGEWFTKGRTYETDCNDEFTADDGYHPGGDEWRGNYWLGNSHWRDCLFPLVRRPAKVGEWVYIERFTQGHSDKAKVGNIYQVSRVYGDDVLIDVTTGNGFEIGEFLVLDGYHGDPA